MNPMDLQGPAFLGIWIVGWLVVALGVIGVRAWVRRAPYRSLELEPEAWAYAIGGMPRAIESVVIGLQHRGIVKLVGDEVQLVALEQVLDARNAFRGHVVDERLTDLERSVVERLPARLAELVVEPHRERALVEQLVVKRVLTVRDTARRVVLWLLPALWLGVGLAKLVVGIARDKPVLLLVVALGAAVVGCRRYVRLPRLTTLGTRTIARLRRENRGLEVTARFDQQLVGARDMVLAYALFGPMILDRAVAALMPSYIAAKAASSSLVASSSCAGYTCCALACSTGSSCGSSCGGGGGSCGGGGGCGGGGCGGCS